MVLPILLSVVGVSVLHAVKFFFSLRRDVHATSWATALTSLNRPEKLLDLFIFIVHEFLTLIFRHMLPTLALVVVMLLNWLSGDVIGRFLKVIPSVLHGKRIVLVSQHCYLSRKKENHHIIYFSVEKNNKIVGSVRYWRYSKLINFRCGLPKISLEDQTKFGIVPDLIKRHSTIAGKNDSVRTFLEYVVQYPPFFDHFDRLLKQVEHDGLNLQTTISNINPAEDLPWISNARLNLTVKELRSFCTRLARRVDAQAHSFSFDDCINDIWPSRDDQ